MDSWHPPPWALPVIVIALVVPPFLGFAFGGAALGAALGFVAIAGLIVLAARAQPEGPIPLARTGPEAPLLAIALAPIEDAATANEIATLAEAGEQGRPATDGYSALVLAPVQSTVIQRWFGEEEPGRVAAQERLAISVATLTAAGCHAEGRVVDQDPGQAIEDAAAQHGARRVVFVVAGTSSDRLVEQARGRLAVPVHRVAVGTEGATVG